MNLLRGASIFIGFDENVGEQFTPGDADIIIVNISDFDVTQSGKTPLTLIVYVPASFVEDTNIAPEIEFTFIKSTD